MSYDSLAALQATKNLYLSKRGGFQDPISPSKRIPYTTYGDVVKIGQEVLGKMTGGDFEKTSSYERALAKFKAALPTAKFSQAFVSQNHAATYPYNQEFWGAALEFVIARRAAGMVPGTWALVKESIVESVKDRLDELNNLPGMGWLKTTVKTAAVVGVGFLVWKYVLPELKKRKALAP